MARTCVWLESDRPCVVCKFGSRCSEERPGTEERVEKAITIPLAELSKFLKQMHGDGSYDVTFRLSGDGAVHDLHMVLCEREPRRVNRPVRSVEAPPDERALKAEVTLRRIAMACLHARTTKDYASAVSNIEAAHSAWVADEVDIAQYRTASGVSGS